MGMYTGLRCRVVVKEKYRGLIEYLMSEEIHIHREALVKRSPWALVAERAKSEGLKISQSLFEGATSLIPFGDDSIFWACRWDSCDWQREFVKDSGHWQFQCALKNYASEIETFINLLLSEFAESFVCVYSQYCEDHAESGEMIVTHYELGEGGIVHQSRKLISEVPTGE